MSDTFDHEADAWDSLLFGEADDVPFRMRKRQDIVCKYCGKKGFHWKETKYGWRLEDKKGQLHSCKNHE